MAKIVNPPSFTKTKGYERYKQEILAWSSVTDLAKDKRGVVVALSLPENDESGIRERVFDEVDIAELQTNDGLSKLIAFMDKVLGKDDLADSLEKYEDFEEYQRSKDQTVAEFITKFDQKYKKIDKLDMKLPSPVLAFKLLKKANISKAEKMLVLSGMNYEQKSNLYEQAKASLLKFKGEQGGGIEAGVASGMSAAIKLEPAWLAENEEALWTAGFARRSNNYRSRGRGRGWRGNSGRFTGSAAAYSGKQKPMNPDGADGKPILCRSCGSYRHLVKNCPDTQWQKMGASVHITETDEQEQTA